MRNLLVGNGINIQFNRTDYTSQQIVLRILKNFDRDDFPSHIIVNYPYLMKNYMGQLYLEAREMVAGEYDKYAFGSAEKASLSEFKERYASKIAGLKMTEIGFEDYYLIHDLLCHKTNVQNPEQFYIREAMRIAYLYSIYNDGEINQLHLDYPEAFVDYLSGFNNIFTTNYDSNIELAVGLDVFHIHGQFDKKSDVYNAASFRNQLPDSPIRDFEVDENYYYLYSNALTTYCGEYKEFQLNQHSQANSCVEKMAAAYLSDPNMKREVDSWTKCPNQLTANLGYAIQLKAANQSLAFSDDYHFDKFKSITGTLEILGLSPWNDFHIFEAIDAADLEKCVYYYHSEHQCATIETLLPSLSKRGAVVFESANAFWENCYGEE